MWSALWRVLAVVGVVIFRSDMCLRKANINFRKTGTQICNRFGIFRNTKQNTASFGVKLYNIQIDYYLLQYL